MVRNYDNRKGLSQTTGPRVHRFDTVVHSAGYQGAKTSSLAELNANLATAVAMRIYYNRVLNAAKTKMAHRIVSHIT